jgi:hypothetical protein
MFSIALQDGAETNERRRFICRSSGRSQLAGCEWKYRSEHQSDKRSGNYSARNDASPPDHSLSRFQRGNALEKDRREYGISDNNKEVEL